MYSYLISLMVVLPLLGAVLQAVLPSGLKSDPINARALAKYVALGTSAVASVCGILLIAGMQAPFVDTQAMQTFPWIGAYAIHYDMAIDGLNAPLVLLISILFPVLIAAEMDRGQGARGMHGLFLILQTAFIGTVCAQDLFLQFFFWALTALPFYFLIGIWGSKDREAAATHAAVSAAIGNALFFGALILVYYALEPHTFSLRELAGGKLNGKTVDFMGQTLSLPVVAFSLIAAGLALRAAIWPIHGWFTRVANEAPLSVVVLMGALTLPTAIYVFERFVYTLFPETIVRFSPAIVVVGSISLLMGAFCAVGQKNLRSLLAFLCISGSGALLIGEGSLSSPGLVGAVYEKLVLGLGIAGFALFANLLAERLGTSEFADENGVSRLGGLAFRSPAIAVIAGISIASLLGFPGLGGFVGYSLIFIGSFATYPLAALFAGLAVTLASYSAFTMYRHVFLGSSREEVKNARFSDLTAWEKAYLFPIVAALLLFGLYPKPLIELVRPTATALLSMVK